MSWTGLGPTDPFGPHNLPWCAFQAADPAPGPGPAPADGQSGLGVRIGDRVLNLTAAERQGLVHAGGTLAASTLNPFLALGRPAWSRVRAEVSALLQDDTRRSAVEALLTPIARLRLRLPIDIGDYVDFYSSEHHATNVGRILRPGQPALLPNWRHLPIGYHGRAGTVIVSGTPVRRPWGQLPTADGPVFGPTTRLDIEAELGFVIGTPSQLGTSVSTRDFREHVFGAVIVNDWSARDIQAWEYQPLGPFLGKSFATSISPWVVPLEALDVARIAAPVQQPAVVAYLREDDRYTYDVELTVRLNETVVSRPPFASLYWTPAQQLAHLTANGATVRTGDLFASGTISGPAPEQWGSLLELTHGGTVRLTLSDATTRAFLDDGDTVVIEAVARGANGTAVGFGSVAATIDPAATVDPAATDDPAATAAVDAADG